MFASTASLQASVFVVTPSDLVDNATFNNGNSGYLFSYDSGPGNPGPPIGVDVPGPSGCGLSSWWSDVQGSAVGGGRDYSTLRINLSALFGAPTYSLTVGDIQSISYYTKKGVQDTTDWQLRVYTTGLTTWYGYRFNFVRPDADNTNWNLWSTDSSGVSDIFDKVANAYIPLGTAGTLSGMATSYGNAPVLFVDISASYMTTSPSADSYLDGVVITLKDGSSATLDLAVVPVPPAFLLAGIGVGAVAVARRVRRRK